MIRFNRFNQRAALAALLLCFSLSSSANDIQDANKLFQRGQHAQALSKVDAFLANQPKDAQARFLKGLILTEQGHTDESIRIFTALTADYPELPEPYNNLAVLYAGQGQYEKAKVALEMAIRTHPSYSTAHENLGDIYAKMASQAYDRALQLDRSNASSKTKLALIRDLFTPGVKSTGVKSQVASVTNPPTITPTLTNPATAPNATPPVVVVAPAPAATVTASAPVIASTEPSAPKPAVTTISPNSNAEVLKAVHDWASAWSSKNVNQYLAMYAKNFKTPHNEPRSGWEQQRRERIGKPKTITISISNAKVKLLDDSNATVSFTQSYRAGTLKSTTRKTLEMTKTNGLWQIQSERTGV